MTSGGNSIESSVAAETEKMFFCYQCNQTITISITSSADPFCPLCNGGFLEEYVDPNPNPIPNLILPMSDLISSRLPFIPVMDFTNPSFLGQSMEPQSTTTTQQQPDAFDPVRFIHNHLLQLQSSGINVQFLVENQNQLSDPANPLPGNHGDYFFGRGLEDLIQQLAEDDQNRYGTPPASKSAIDALPTVKVSKEILQSEMNQCAVCMDEFEDGIEAKQMPCKHVYHHDCLLPWLQLHNSCPVCRHELPTDDPDYENRTRGGQTSGDGEGSSGETHTPRRFSISFPWSFRRPDANSDSGSGSDMDTREDDLD
ncbi:PREDICTED: E3 ubiquitin-protein ligase RING1-like [Camelina sativa]|uniref:RING-type E3 ubiquitin transferase n=1 Tax=Camelina sativa TaxID=90675 RepID=A0ABM0VVZ7_CAMSA|nr:PREDICTED: E3 ubiquitin-protein ligase RING1-like [Camelina sativa]